MMVDAGPKSQCDHHSVRAADDNEIDHCSKERGAVATREADAPKPATIYDVAKVAGVSHQTVSRLLLGYQGIRPETRQRVLGAIEQLDYRTNIAARNLRNGRTGMISLAIPSLDQPYFAELAQAIMRAARPYGLTVFVETTDGIRERELQVISGARGNFVDGVIYVPLALSYSDISELNIEFPLVLIGDRVLHSRFDHVTLPNFEGAKAAVNHLLSLGRRRIAAIGVEEASDFGASTPRLNGYRAALEEAGIAVDPDLLISGGDWIRPEGVAGVERLLASHTPFDAVFGFNDALALGALRALQSAGLRVPEDVAVIGFDDTQDALYVTPTLTSVAPGRDELAVAAVQMLNRRLTGAPAGDQPGELVPTFTMAIRESTTGLG
jgi:DNA-binding LacI/PurR family transcriptional regulator